MLLSSDKILEELAKDCEADGGSDATASLDEAMKRLDETSKKVEDLQATIAEQFNKTVEDISDKLLATHNNPGKPDETPGEDPEEEEV